MSKQQKISVMSCTDLWKLYGKAPEEFLASPANRCLSHEEINAAGYIVASRDVTLNVYKGEILVIMGLSGSGKSTLLRCLSRLIESSHGEIEIEGQDLRAMSEKELIDLRRNKMGMVFQNFALLPHRTVLDNVIFPLEMRGQDKYKRRERALEVIRLVGLEGREEYFPRELSGGQQQRVGIARSLAIEPDIWFLDEPFSALDPLIRREMQNEFLRLQAMLGKTIIFITHDFDEALRLADRIAIMKDGAIQQLATPSEVALKPANEYVKRFTEDIDKRRIITVGTLATEEMPKKLIPKKASDDGFLATQTLHEIGHALATDKRDIIPIKFADGSFKQLHKNDALALLFGN